LALGIADRVLMLEHAVYSVISPEGCAAILWDDPAKVPEAAERLRMTAQDLMEFGMIDEIVPEPIGGAHRDPQGTADRLAKSIHLHLGELIDFPRQDLLDRRAAKYRRMGAVLNSSASGR
jgi:acetyl-CoA carboxylase carboxyl transferase subunit alpha